MNKRINVIFRRLNLPKDVEQIERKYSNREYNKLSRLENEQLSETGYLAVNNWRLLHAEPLDDVTDWLSHTAQHIDESSIVSKRIKRIASIVPKIQKGYELTQIQDIGGCRAIFSTYEKLQEWLQWAKTTTLFSSVRQVDYIQNPKDSGYRSVHLICTYYSEHSKYNALKIEIQARTLIQHSWATALEIVDIYTVQNLKGGQGSDLWKRFFVLMASYLAIDEGLPTVPKTPITKEEISSELISLEKQIGAWAVLQGSTLAKSVIETEKVYEYFILQCSESGVIISSFPKEHYNAGFEEYLFLERSAKDNNEVVALVSAESISQLRAAYPNYFNDTHFFLWFLRNAIKRPGEIIYD